MIYINPVKSEAGYAELHHLWLGHQVKAGNHEVYGTRYNPDTPAMCGFDLSDRWNPHDEVDPYLIPANETTVSDVHALLREGDLCEDCRTRMAIYLGIEEEVGLWAFDVDTPDKTCPTCNDPGEIVLKGVDSPEEYPRGRILYTLECPICGAGLYQGDITIPSNSMIS